MEPKALIERHTRGDWSGGPVKWIEKNHLRFRGVNDYPVMSVYQLHPSESRVCVATEADFSKTSITNWPDGSRDAESMPLTHAAAEYEKQRGVAAPDSFARNLLDGFGTTSRQSRTRRRPDRNRGQGIDIDR
jgi:hypothetical protein